MTQRLFGTLPRSHLACDRWPTPRRRRTEPFLRLVDVNAHCCGYVRRGWYTTTIPRATAVHPLGTLGSTTASLLACLASCEPP